MDLKVLKISHPEDIKYTDICLFANHLLVFEHQNINDNFSNSDRIDQVEKAGNITFYSYKIYKEGQLIHDYVPAVITSSGNPVVYDLVTDSYEPYSGNSDNVTNYNLSHTPYSHNTATVLSAGNIWIIIRIFVLTIGVVTMLTIKKRQKNS